MKETLSFQLITTHNWILFLKTGLGKVFAWDMKKMVLSAIEAEEDENERLIQLDSGGLGVLGSLTPS